MAFDPYLWLLGLLLAWATVIGRPVTARNDHRLTYVEIGFLRRRRSGAIGTAVAQLHAEGQAAVRRRQLARGANPLRPGVDPLARAVYLAVLAPTWLIELPGKPQVKRALRDLVHRLAGAGLVPGRLRWFLARVILVAAAVVCLVQLLPLRALSATTALYLGALAATVLAWLAPRRTLAGHRRLARLRKRYGSLLADPEGATARLPTRRGLAYALTGQIDQAMAGAFARVSRSGGQVRGFGLGGFGVIGDGGGGIGGGASCGDGGGGGGDC